MHTTQLNINDHPLDKHSVTLLYICLQCDVAERDLFTIFCTCLFFNDVFTVNKFNKLEKQLQIDL